MNWCLALFVTILLPSLGAQTLPPALLENLPPGFSQEVVGSFSHTCSPSCTPVAGDPLIESGATGGHRYDLAGNLFLIVGPNLGLCGDRPCIITMTPGGAFSKFADGPSPFQSCNQPTADTATVTSTGTPSMSFNTAVNSLYVVTILEALTKPPRESKEVANRGC